MGISQDSSRLPLITYVVPFYNGAALLRETLASVRSQTYGEVEVVLVDDGSEQDCGPIVAEFGSCVRVIRTVNHGVSGARNVGLAASKGAYVVFLDQDDLVMPNHAERLSEPMRNNPTIDGSYCKVVILREGLPPMEQDFDRYDSPLALFKRRMTLSMGAVMFRKSALEGLGGFDLTFCNVGEDWDFCLRFARFRTLEYVREPLFCFRRHRAQASRGADRLAEGALAVLLKHRRYQGPGAVTAGEAREARAGIMGYWAESYREAFKKNGMEIRGAARLLAKTLAHPSLLAAFVVPPLRRVFGGGRRAKS
jgi:glycosyltransferase involved in cell wall biosynthesis